MIYPIKSIGRVEIIRPHTTLKKWYESQADKPDILFNASLYTSNGTPCGTIWDDGNLISDQGNGWGFGTKDKTSIVFDGPYSGGWWWDYITAYPAIVRRGEAISSAPWVDRYVFDKSLNRIAFGRLKSGNYAVFCENRKTILQLAKSGAEAGFDELCNLDGGGSRALLYEGKWIYTSARTPYNAVAIWYESQQEGGQPMKVKCIRKTATYDRIGNAEKGRYIAPGDVCEINSTLTANLLVEITYPVTGGTRKAYVKDIGNFLRG